MAKAFGGLGVTAGLAADRTSMTGMSAGQQFYETDTNRTYVYDGSVWRVIGTITGTSVQRAAFSGMLTGQQFYETDTKLLYMYNGSAWILVDNLNLSYAPTFWATRNSSTSSAAQTIVFNVTNENVGGHYSTSTGLFTAPVGGVYTFHFQALQNSGVTGNSMFKFIKNGVVINGPATYSDRAGWGTVAMGTTTYLASGNTMGIYQGYSAAMYGDGTNLHNGFSGALVSYR